MHFRCYDIFSISKKKENFVNFPYLRLCCKHILSPEKLNIFKFTKIKNHGVPYRYVDDAKCNQVLQRQNCNFYFLFALKLIKNAEK